MTDNNENLNPAYLPGAVSRMAADTSQDGEIDLWAYLGILRRRWPLVFLVMVVSVGVTAFITLRMTKIYRATTTVRIETQAPQVLGKDIEAVDEMGSGAGWANIEYYETQYKIIASRDVASRVVREFKLNEDPDFLEIPEEERHPFKPVSVEEAAETLQEMLTVEPVKDSRIVSIHVDNPSPKRAQLYANAIAKAYLDKNLETMLQSTVDAVDWLSKQLDDAQHKLSASEEAAYEFKKDHGILSMSLEERQNMITAQMTDVATKLTDAKAERIALESKKAALAGVADVKDPMAIPFDALNSNSLIQELKQQYGALSQEYSEMSERYGPNFPLMVELDAKIERIQSDIAREVNNVLKAVDVSLAASKKTEKGLTKTLAALSRQAMALGEKSVAYNRLEREKINNERVYELLIGRSKEAHLSRLLRVNNVHILDPALLPKYPVKPRFNVNILVALVVGLILGFGLALLVELFDRTIKSQEEVESLGLTFLGIIPFIDASNPRSRDQSYYAYGEKRHLDRKKAKQKSTGRDEPKPIIRPDLFVHDFPKSHIAESCRAIRTNLLFMSASRPIKKILITSPLPQEGKTMVTVSLAIAMARAGARVLIVDTDMRRPRIHRTFDIHQTTGISTMVLGESTVADSIRSTGIENLDVLVCGPIPPNPAELIHSERFDSAINNLCSRYDHMIFDSPPVTMVTDAAILSKMVDGTVLVLKYHSTTRDAGRRAVGVLRDIDATILGSVVNSLDLASRNGRSYYNGDYYGKHDGYSQPD
jgi:succinoglycan biosynthesis transport protein ExoP